MSQYSGSQAAYGCQYGYVPGSNAPSVYHTTGSTVARWAAHHYPAPSVVASTAPSERINAHWRWADDVSERMDIAERAQQAQQAGRAASHTGHSVYSSSHAPAYFTDARGRLIDIVQVILISLMTKANMYSRCDSRTLAIPRKDKAKQQEEQEKDAKRAAKYARRQERRERDPEGEERRRKRADEKDREEDRVMAAEAYARGDYKRAQWLLSRKDLCAFMLART